MPRNGSGTYSLPASNPVVTGTTISSTWANTTLSDIATALTQSLASNGQTVPTANLPMGGFKHTNVAAATATTDYLRADQALNSSLQWLTSVSGTNTITASTSITPAAYAAGQTYRFVSSGKNTDAVTLNVSGLGAKNVYKRQAGGLVALVAGDIVGSTEYSFTYDGTQFVLNEQRPYSHGADIASASTINLDTATGDCVDVTGTTAITAITLSEGQQCTTRFTDALTLTNGASLVLIGGADITTAAGAFAVWRGYASGVVRLVSYSTASGKALYAPSKIQTISASVSSNALTISASDLSLDFRSTTLGSGAVTTVNGTPSNLVISSGSTLGTVNSVQSDIVVLAINNAGTIELAAVNMAGGTQLDETNLVSTTAEGGAGAADSATTVYSTTARTNVAYRVLGVLRSTQATAGTWATAPSLIQGCGGQAFITMGNLGFGQTWQDLTASRAGGTTYYNTTGKPIVVNIRATNASSGNPSIVVNGVTVSATTTQTNIAPMLSAIIPPGASYSMTLGGAGINFWVELR